MRRRREEAEEGEGQTVGAKVSDRSALPPIIKGRKWKSLATAAADDAL